MVDKNFRVLLADTSESLKLHYMVRYRVFCLETRYEDEKAFPDKMERDDYDSRSVHFIVRAEETGQWVASMRLVVGQLHSLPLMEHCSFHGDTGIGADERVAEISRLCVIGPFRRRGSDLKAARGSEQSGGAADNLVRLERRREPRILLNLIQAAVDYAGQHDIRYGYALMAEPLMRILKGLGLRIAPIGPLCEHRGLRRPYFMDLHTLLEDMPGKGGIIKPGRSAAYMRYSEWRTAFAAARQEPLTGGNRQRIIG